jgi:hypothetical protein
VNAIKIETTVDEATARAIPALRPLLGQRVELIALQAEPAEQPQRKRITLDEFLTHRLTAPPGIKLSIEDMETAIEQGAAGAID